MNLPFFFYGQTHLIYFNSDLILGLSMQVDKDVSYSFVGFIKETEITTPSLQYKYGVTGLQAKGKREVSKAERREGKNRGRKEGGLKEETESQKRKRKAKESMRKDRLLRNRRKERGKQKKKCKHVALRKKPIPWSLPCP